MFKEFKEFAVKGNVIDLAIGVIIGAAFTTIVNSLVNDIITPVLGIFLGKINFAGLRFEVGASTITYGKFLNAVFQFVIVAFVLFLFVKQVNRFRRKGDPTEKECPFCFSKIPIKATRCPECTSQIK